MRLREIIALVLLPFVGSAQTLPSAGNVGPQPSAFSRHLLTLPNMSQWQGELGVNPNGNLVAGSNVTLQVGNGITQINSSGSGGTNFLSLTGGTMTGSVIFTNSSSISLYSGTLYLYGSSNFGISSIYFGAYSTLVNAAGVTNSVFGTVTLNGTNTVSASCVHSESGYPGIVFFSLVTPGGTVGFPYVSSFGTGSFLVKSTSASDTSTVNWMFVRNGY